MFELITPMSYWVLTILWFVILSIYLIRLRKVPSTNKLLILLLFILSIDAFRTVFESVYFGLFFNSLFGLLPASIHELLGQPELIILPKMVNVAAGILVLFILIRRWMPLEAQEREQLKQQLVDRSQDVW
ncbi:hypothetical protein V5T82_14835 [Magnetovibrio sp. PR-2]|uniref:hypothetical protein n=1 Tax=Magnetovibrio sp. PR-2 TaxID=3120356 RepID=UPI002FCE4E05